jgi:hypothetical protein
MLAKKRIWMAGGVLLLVAGGGVFFKAGGDISGSLSDNQVQEPASVRQLTSLANQLPKAKASEAQQEAAAQAAAVLGHKPAAQGAAGQSQGLAAAENLTAAAPPPQYVYGISPGNQPPGLKFDSMAEWVTNFEGQVFQVFGGANTNDAGDPISAAVLVERDSSRGPVLVGDYSYPKGGNNLLVPRSFSGQLLTLSYPQGTVNFDLATDSFS